MFLLHFYVFILRVHMCARARTHMHMKVRGQLPAVSSCFPPCGFWGLISNSFVSRLPYQLSQPAVSDHGVLWSQH